MPTESTVAEKPVSGAAQMRATDRAAEIRANAPVKPWTPAPLRPPPHPAVVALREKADAVRTDAATDLARADSMTTAANVVGQRIASLETERTAIQQRLANIPANLKAQRESARGTIHRLYGKTTLDFSERESLNGACLCLAWSPLLEKEIPSLKKDLQNRLAEIEKELASLTDGGQK